MGQALYRKYRSKSLDEVVGQEHITRTLQRALDTGKISHAYLFTGPRGVGKTSIARILAHAVNDLPYKDDSQHLDIIEIDAASNRRIDEIRELRDKVHAAPTSAKYKVYIIDEVHMLTKEAFNALLKTLEEPPAHVIFILATTEIHKVPDTIVSRTQRFSFKPVSEEAVFTHLKQLAKQEKFSVDDEALRLIARHGSGSFRDSISLLDQASSLGNKMTRADVETLLGIVPEDAIKDLLKHVFDGEAVEVTESLDELLTKSTAVQIAQQVISRLQGELLEGSISDHEEATEFMRRLVEVPASHDPSAALYITLLQVTLRRAPNLASKTTKPVAKPTVTEETNNVVEIPSSHTPTESLEPQELWPKALAEIKKHHATLYSIARMAKASETDDVITLELSFPFHQKQLSDSKNVQIISDVLRKITGRDFSVTTQLSTTQPKPKASEPKTNPAITTISNIFGDAEVLES